PANSLAATADSTSGTGAARLLAGVHHDAAADALKQVLDGTVATTVLRAATKGSHVLVPAGAAATFTLALVDGSLMLFESERRPPMVSNIACS
ncbi:hypothetical protein, partial [Klebsiella pneumoniae]|uniref:hypothetical protein n=1 Tax=Klebsiella pneumoniae TaxID=573 RepID=UPI003013C3D7